MTKLLERRGLLGTEQPQGITVGGAPLEGVGDERTREALAHPHRRRVVEAAAWRALTGEADYPRQLSVVGLAVRAAVHEAGVSDTPKDDEGVAGAHRLRALCALPTP